MKALLQRVSQASVTVNQSICGEIGTGYLIFLGIEPEDSSIDRQWLIKKITTLKLFEGEDGRMSLNLLDVGGKALVVSQFTLHASIKKGTRPSFHRSAPPQMAALEYNSFCEELSQALGLPVATGVFGEHMEVSLLNDGPVTLMIDSKNPE